MKTQRLLRSYYIFLRDFFKDIFNDKIGHYASSLSWSTLFSIIPLLVILLWVFTTLPLFHAYHDQVETLIFTNLMPSNSEEVMGYIQRFMENSNKLGYVGISYVTIAAILFFKNYDFIVNDIFKVPGRTVLQAVKTYTLLIVTIPVMMGLSFYLSTTLQTYLNKSTYTSAIQLFHFVPFLIVWMTFYILFHYSANTRIQVKASLISSFITSLIWYLSKSAFIFYVIHNKTYESVYGSISIVLFFFLWIYLSWAIFLHGLKFCVLLNREEEIERI